MVGKPHCRPQIMGAPLSHGLACTPPRISQPIAARSDPVCSITSLMFCTLPLQWYSRGLHSANCSSCPPTCPLNRKWPSFGIACNVLESVSDSAVCVTFVVESGASRSLAGAAHRRIETERGTSVYTRLGFVYLFNNWWPVLTSPT